MEIIKTIHGVAKVIHKNFLYIKQKFHWKINNIRWESVKKCSYLGSITTDNDILNIFKYMYLLIIIYNHDEI